MHICTKMKNLIFALVVVVGLASVDAYVYSRCDVAKALLANGWPRNQLENWVCLVEAESSRNTAAKGGPDSDGSYDYGLYQINGRYWCKYGEAGGVCNIDCKKFLDDNIADDTKCAQVVFQRHGFNAWYGWVAKCQGTLPDLSGCGV